MSQCANSIAEVRVRCAILIDASRGEACGWQTGYINPNFT